MAALMDIISIVVITISVPALFLVGMKVFKNEDYSKMIKIIAVSLFVAEVIRFFVVANKFNLGKVPADQLKIGFVTFVSIFGLFAAFFKKEVALRLRRVFVLVALLPLVIGIFQGRVYTLAEDEYAIVKGLYFLESGLSVLLAALYIKEERLSFDLFDLLIGAGIVLAYFGLSIFYVNYWALSIELNAMFFIEKAAMLVVSILTFVVFKFLLNKNCEKKV